MRLAEVVKDIESAIKLLKANKITNYEIIIVWNGGENVKCKFNCG